MYKFLTYPFIPTYIHTYIHISPFTNGNLFMKRNQKLLNVTFYTDLHHTICTEEYVETLNILIQYFFFIFFLTFFLIFAILKISYCF